MRKVNLRYKSSKPCSWLVTAVMTFIYIWHQLSSCRWCYQTTILITYFPSTLSAKFLFVLKHSLPTTDVRGANNLLQQGQSNMVCQHNPQKCWMFQVPFINIKVHQTLVISDQYLPNNHLEAATSDLQLLTFPFYMLLFKLFCIFLFHYVLPAQIHGFASLSTDYCTICSLGSEFG